MYGNENFSIYTVFRNVISFLNEEFYFGERGPIRSKRFMLKDIDTIKFLEKNFTLKNVGPKI